MWKRHVVFCGGVESYLSEGGNMEVDIFQTMDLEKETKGTYRFKDRDPNSKCPVVYVKKSAFTGRPESIRLSIEVE